MLMHSGRATEHRAGADLAMTRDLGRIRHHHPIPHHAVVGDVRVGHDQTASPQRREPFIATASDVQSRALPNDRPCAHRQSAGTAVELQILGHHPQHGLRIHLDLGPELGPAVDDRMGVNRAPVVHGHPRPDDGEGPDLNAAPQFGAGIDHRRRMYLAVSPRAHASKMGFGMLSGNSGGLAAGPVVAVTRAELASSPSTVTSQASLKVLRRYFSMRE